MAATVQNLLTVRTVHAKTVLARYSIRVMSVQTQMIVLRVTAMPMGSVRWLPSTVFVQSQRIVRRA